MILIISPHLVPHYTPDALPSSILPCSTRHFTYPYQALHLSTRQLHLYLPGNFTYLYQATSLIYTRQLHFSLPGNFTSLDQAFFFIPGFFFFMISSFQGLLLSPGLSFDPKLHPTPRLLHLLFIHANSGHNKGGLTSTLRVTFAISPDVISFPLPLGTGHFYYFKILSLEKRGCNDTCPHSIILLHLTSPCASHPYSYTRAY